MKWVESAVVFCLLFSIFYYSNTLAICQVRALAATIICQAFGTSHVKGLKADSGSADFNPSETCVICIALI